MTTDTALRILGISSIAGLYAGRIVEVVDGDDAALAEAKAAAAFLGYRLEVDEDGDLLLAE